ncbi:hypothetical protein GCM10009647_089380 [Streptomyces sanglieri]
MYVPTGNDLREARKSRGLSQKEIAERADVSQPLLSRLETDDVDPRLPTLHKIVQAINNTEDPLGETELEVAVPSAIRKVRMETGLTQSELAERAGFSQPLIARIENEEVNPRASTLREILTELEIDPDASIASSDVQSESSKSDTDILATIEKEFENL